MGINTDAVQRLYVAYFNRPADPAGLAYWEGGLPSTTVATQAELTAIARGFSGSIEYAALYSGQTNAQVVNSLYVNLFGRPAEAAGLAHWSAKIADGSETFASIALQLTYSAQGSDATAITNKLTAATAFTNALDTITEISSYFGLAAAAVARTWLATATVDGTLNTPTQVAAALTAALATLNTAVSDMIPAGGGGGGGGGGGDSTAPTLSSISPVDNAINVAVGNNIVLTFSETVALGTGAIVLKKTSDNSIIETFNVATGAGNLGGTVTASGTGVTINPNAGLSANTEYYVTVAATAVKDTANNAYAGILGTTQTVSFTTATNAGSALALAVIGLETINGGSVSPTTAGDDTITGTYADADAAHFNTTDTIDGLGGTDTLNITSNTVAITPPDTMWTNVDNIEKIVFTTTGNGAQTITTGAQFNTSFASLGVAVDLTAANVSDPIIIDMGAFTGAARITTTSSGAAAHTITTGSGAATVTSTTTAGAQDIDGAGLTTVTATSNGAGIQTIGAVSSGNLVTVTAIQNAAGAQNITSTSTADVTVVASMVGGGASGNQNITTDAGNDSVTATYAGGSSNVISTDAGNDAITLLANAGAATANSITGGTGADSIILVSDATPDTINVAVGDSLAVASSYDTITNFNIANDILNLATALIAVNAAGTDGANAGTLKSHTIVSGLITFDDADVWNASVVINAANVADAIAYCVANITSVGRSVMFQYDASGDGAYGAADAVFIFQDGATDTLVELVGLNASTHTILGTVIAGSTVVIA